MLSEDFIAAMSEAIRRYKTQKAFAEATGIHQSRISAYATGKIKFEELSVSTLLKMFPELHITYFSKIGDSGKSVEQTLNDKIDNVAQTLAELQRRVKELEQPKNDETIHSRFSNGALSSIK